MNVLHINNFSAGGGAESVFNLIRNNLDYTINYTGYFKREKDNETPDILFTSWENDNKLIGVFNYVFSFNNYRQLLSFLNNNQVDVIHIHGFFSTISPSILLAIKKFKKNNSNIKIIQTLHDFHLVCPNSSLFNYKRNESCEKCVGKKYKLHILKDQCDRRGFIFSVIKGIRSLLTTMIKHKEIIDIFITPSEFLKNILIKDGIISSKIRVIRNPIIVDKNMLYPNKENMVCYFGRFAKEKNLEFLVNAFSKWKKETNNDFRLLLIGEGEEQDKLKDLAKHSGFSEYILIKDFIPQNELINELRKVKYFSMTSVCYENAPMSILESAAMNIIPIVPDKGGMRETVETVLKAGKTYHAADERSWVETMINIEQYYSKELNLVLESVKKIESLYNLGNFLKELNNVYS